MTIGMPDAYWKHAAFSPNVMLIRPSHSESQRVFNAIINDRSGSESEGEAVVNSLYSDSCLVLPHRPYSLLVREFRQRYDSHEPYLGSISERWNATAIVKEAKVVHFTDWPMEKPWIQTKDEVISREQPECVLKLDRDRQVDCTTQNIWKSFYEDFARRRKDVCGMELTKNP